MQFMTELKIDLAAEKLSWITNNDIDQSFCYNCKFIQSFKSYFLFLLKRLTQIVNKLFYKKSYPYLFLSGFYFGSWKCIEKLDKI